MSSKTKFSSRQEDDKPFLLNVTYTTPLRDLNKERKYNMDHLNYKKKVKRLEYKISEDLEFLKMIINVQNTQIGKLNEILMVNHEIAKALVKEKSPSPIITPNRI